MVNIADVKFDKDYMNYWEKAVDKSIDGTIIAGPREFDYHIKDLNISRDQRVLDLGCSFGRMFPILSTYSENIFGLDVDFDVIEKASAYPYRSLVKGLSESIPFPGNYLDAITAWAVFDIVNLPLSLVECNRVLREGGKLLYTSKNENYFADDTLAWKAERNAKLKGFSNGFSRLTSLVSQVGLFGFEITGLKLFKYRGDMGLNKFENVGLGEEKYEAYEYLIILTKTSPSQLISSQIDNMTSEFSLVARQKAQSNDREAILKFFVENKADE